MRLTLLASPALRIQKTAMTLASRGYILETTGGTGRQSFPESKVNHSFLLSQGSEGPARANTTDPCSRWYSLLSSSLSLRTLLRSMDAGVADDVGFKETQCVDWDRHGLAKLKPQHRPPLWGYLVRAYGTSACNWFVGKNWRPWAA